MSPRKASKKSSTKSAGTKNETVEHYNAILLEDIKSKMEAVIEGMQSVETRLTSKMDDMEAHLSSDITMLKTAVTAHSGEIKELKTAVTAHSGEIRKLESNMQAMEQRLDTKIDQVETRLSDKIDKQDARWTNHENRLTALETTTNS